MTTRIKAIESRLRENFICKHLEVQDDSHLHVGHAGSQDGAGHYTVIIASDSFEGKSKIESHRLVYQALNDMMPREIHALRIIIK